VIDGEIISCVHSSLPGGCGHTEHCLGCGIRQAVQHALANGESFTAMSAYGTVRTPEGPTRMALSISLERVGRHAMLVRIDAARPEP
jgi:hypothetical protein